MEYIYILFLIADAFLAYRFMYKDGSMKQKLLTSLPFVISGIYLTIVMGLYNSAYSLLIVAGLIASFIGDWVLRFDLFGMKGLPGIIAFALAHILYISAFSVRVPLTIKDLWLIVPWAVMLSLEIFAKKKMNINLGATAPAVLVYAMIIDAMVLLGIRAAVLTMNGGISVLRSIVLIAGVIMFIISDAGVCLMMFDGRKEIKTNKKTYKLNSFNVVTYYGGQMLIAASVLV
ncbi:MAG: lysoplasmalogenase [Clostridia bacterium]|nr:lysoplasmalogenase [Clostridia bacterium]